MSKFKPGDRVDHVGYYALGPATVRETESRCLSGFISIVPDDKSKLSNPTRGTYCADPDNLEPLAQDRYYIAGPMTGYEEYNAPAFRAAAEDLRERGFDIISPVEMDEEDGVDLSDPELGEDVYVNALERDIARITTSQVKGVIVLPGWEKSRGAALEVHVARELGKEILSYPDLEPVKRPSAYRPPAEENVLEEADRLVGGDRGEQYGHPLDDFTRTAKIASAILGVEVRPEQIPLLMIAVKLSRIVESPDKRDSIVDIAGYARTYEMTRERQGEPLR